MDHSYKFSMETGYWLRRSRLLKQKLTDGRPDAGRRVIIIAHLVSLRLSGELKIKMLIFHLKNIKCRNQHWLPQNTFFYLPNTVMKFKLDSILQSYSYQLAHFLSLHAFKCFPRINNSLIKLVISLNVFSLVKTHSLNVKALNPVTDKCKELKL